MKPAELAHERRHVLRTPLRRVACRGYPVEELEPRSLFDATMATATALGSVATMRTASGTVGNGDLIDYYKFNVSATTKVQGEASATVGRVDFRIISDQNKNGRADPGETQKFVGNVGGTEVAFSQTLAAGTYFAKVTRVSGNAAYTFTLAAPPTGPDPTLKFLDVALRAVVRPDTTLYLNVPGIPGSSIEPNHKGWIDVSSFAFGVVRKIPDGAFGNDARSRGFLVFQELKFRKAVDVASLPLLLHTAVGTVFPGPITLVLAARIGGAQRDYFEFKLSKAFFASMTVDSLPAGKVLETGSINFARIDVKSTQYDSAGNVVSTQSAYYDREIAKGGFT